MYICAIAVSCIVCGNQEVLLTMYISLLSFANVKNTKKLKKRQPSNEGMCMLCYLLFFLVSVTLYTKQWYYRFFSFYFY